MHATPPRDLMSDPGTTQGAGGLGDDIQRVLVIDPDPAMLRVFECYFAQRGALVVSAMTLAEAERRYASGIPWRLVIADSHLPDGSGWQFCRTLRQRWGEPLPCLFISGAPAPVDRPTPGSVLTKPFSLVELDVVIDRLLQLDR